MCGNGDSEVTKCVEWKTNKRDDMNKTMNGEMNGFLCDKMNDSRCKYNDTII